MIPGARWFAVTKFDPRAVALYARHYSSVRNGKTVGDWLRHGITAPGESLVLLTADSRALFVWLKQRYHGNGQEGINCAVFRNEGSCLSSELIREAEQLAWERWPGERLYTYIDPRRIKGTNPGFCFKVIGWRRCGTTKIQELHILEKLPGGKL